MFQKIIQKLLFPKNKSQIPEITAPNVEAIKRQRNHFQDYKRIENNGSIVSHLQDNYYRRYEKDKWIPTVKI